MDKKTFLYVFLSLLILVFFLLSYDKCRKEFFKSNEIQINLNFKNNILWLSDNLENINQLDKGTLFKKTNELIYSNEKLYRNFNYSGFIFKPDMNTKNIKIGLKNNDKKNMSFCYHIKDNNIFEILELDEINKTKSQNIDFCSVVNIDKCLNKKNNYKYNTDDYLGIMIDNDIVKYILITKKYINNNISYIGNIIHKSVNKPVFPFQISVENKKNENFINESYWINNNTITNNLWSVNVLDTSKPMDMPDKKEIVDAPTFYYEEEEEEKVYTLDNIPPWDKKIFIVGYNFTNNLLKLKNITNLNETDIKFLKKMNINLVFNLDNQERILKIPYQIENNNLTDLEINILNYQDKLINNNEFYVYIDIIRSDTIDEKNIISNKKKIIIK
uniref:Uncharacterized protein n=1 Tax=Mimiviridae sp. ChoanoV1 TaxID=2596887 RepID=A0A5B8IQI5_9VIRU|nr:hypothetical protein 5_21 [Mimiviridae sp. ChoanoV1]